MSKHIPLTHPCPGYRVSQFFGIHAPDYAAYGLPHHEGVDFAAPVGTPIRAMHAGTVTVATYGPTYGNQVKLYGGGPLGSLYAHLSKYHVKPGQAVAPGQVLGLSGNTGHSEAPHVHIGLKIEGIETPCKGWIDPLLFILDGVWLGSKLSYHIQKPVYPPALRLQVIASRAQFVKILDPDKGEAKPFGDKTYIGRLYWDGEPDKELVWKGSSGADEWWAMAWPRIATCPWVRIWESANEPAVDTPERAWLFVAFELRRIQLLHAHGLLAASGCFSTGNPLLSLWPIMRDVLAATDYLALHEYGMKTERPQMGRTNWNLWHLYRHEKVIATLREHDCRVPPILITETGIDYAGDKDKDGWRAQGLGEEEFMTQLAGYDRQLPPEVLVSTPFTWEPENWPSFDMGGKMSRVFTAYLAEMNGEREPLPEDETATDAATLASKARWWQEEQIRQREAGNDARADEIMYGQTKLLYRLENRIQNEAG